MASQAQSIRSARRIRPDLSEMAPGPELGLALSQIELSRLCHTDLIEVLRAEYRQANHQRARLMAAMVETGVCERGRDDQARRRPEPEEFAADEVRAALMLTRTAAERVFWFAQDLCERLPEVYAALLAGRCDEARAQVFARWTGELDPEAARGLCAALLPQAGALTTGQLIEAIKTRAIAIDPDWAHRRYEEAVAGRRVVGSRLVLLFLA